MNETQILDATAQHFQRRGGEVYAEIEVPGIGRVDQAIIFRRSARLIVIEGKDGDGWIAYAQARRWAGRCSQSFVAVPYVQRTAQYQREIGEAIEEAYRHALIGRLAVGHTGTVSEEVEARDFGSKFIEAGILERCTAATLWHPTTRPSGVAGGMADPVRASEFTEADVKLAELLRARPKISVSQAMSEIAAPRGYREHLEREHRIHFSAGVWRFTDEEKGAAA